MRPIDNRPVVDPEPPDAGRGPARGVLALCLVTLLTAATPAFGASPDDGSGDSAPVRTPSGVYLNIEVTDDTVSLEAWDFPLIEILEQLAEDLAFQLRVTGELNGRVTWSVDNRSPNEIIGRLLNRRSHVTVFDRPKTDFGKTAIRELHVIGDTGRKQAPSYETYAELILRQQQWKDRKVRLDRMKQLADEQTAEASWELADILFDDPDTRIRHAAAIALGRYSDPESTQMLRSALQDSSHWVRKEALRSLASIGNPESIEDVKFVIDTDPDERVRELAGRILKMLERKVQQ